MSLCPIMPPAFCFPKKDLENPCPCQDIAVELTHKEGIIFWLKQAGESVSQGETIANMEVEKKTVELLAPYGGILTEIVVGDGENFEFGNILGYIEVL